MIYATSNNADLCTQLHLVLSTENKTQFVAGVRAYIGCHDEPVQVEMMADHPVDGILLIPTDSRAAIKNA
jgi:hypothetical protein